MRAPLPFLVLLGVVSAFTPFNLQADEFGTRFRWHGIVECTRYRHPASCNPIGGFCRYCRTVLDGGDCPPRETISHPDYAWVMRPQHAKTIDGAKNVICEVRWDPWRKVSGNFEAVASPQMAPQQNLKNGSSPPMSPQMAVGLLFLALLLVTVGFLFLARLLVH
eukprot:Trichotokara_eunicae@DN4917_c0_g1_i2.p1